MNEWMNKWNRDEKETKKKEREQEERFNKVGGEVEKRADRRKGDLEETGENQWEIRKSLRGHEKWRGRKENCKCVKILREDKEKGKKKKQKQEKITTSSWEKLGERGCRVEVNGNTKREEREDEERRCGGTEIDEEEWTSAETRREQEGEETSMPRGIRRDERENEGLEKAPEGKRNTRINRWYQKTRKNIKMGRDGGENKSSRSAWDVWGGKKTAEERERACQLVSLRVWLTLWWSSSPGFLGKSTLLTPP